MIISMAFLAIQHTETIHHRDIFKILKPLKAVKVTILTAIQCLLISIVFLSSITMMTELQYLLLPNNFCYLIEMAYHILKTLPFLFFFF